MTVLLYMGPLLAGLAGFGWAMLPPFLSVFLMWLYLLRPHQWPQRPGEWLSARALGAVLTQVLSQLLLVTVLFGVGRGIGGVTGSLPMLHPVLPVAMSFLALMLMRLMWNPDRALAEGITIDQLIEAVDRPRAATEGLDGSTADPAAAVAGLLTLPDSVAPDAALPLLQRSLDGPAGRRALRALAEALTEAPATRHPGLRAALLLWATDPERFAAGTAPDALRAAFAAAGKDNALLGGLLPRAAALLHAIPDRIGQFPKPAALLALSRSDIDPALARAAADLAAQLGRGDGETASSRAA